MHVCVYVCVCMICVHAHLCIYICVMVHSPMHVCVCVHVCVSFTPVPLWEWRTHYSARPAQILILLSHPPNTNVTGMHDLVKPSFMTSQCIPEKL